MPGGVGTWELLHPASETVRSGNAERSQPAGDVIAGPHPTRQELVTLNVPGVTIPVSLLNPVLPCMMLPLDRERERRHGLVFVTFVVGGIPGQKSGEDSVGNSQPAARAALWAVPREAFVRALQANALNVEYRQMRERVSRMELAGSGGST